MVGRTFVSKGDQKNNVYLLKISTKMKDTECMRKLLTNLTRKLKAKQQI